MRILTPVVNFSEITRFLDQCYTLKASTYISVLLFLGVS